MKMRMVTKQEPAKKVEIDETVKAELGKFKADIEETIKKHLGSKGLQDAELKAKISKIVEETQEQREKALKESDKNNKEGFKCLTCGDHVHETVVKGSRVKCVGPNCGKEYEMVDLTSDLQCAGCGAPLKEDIVVKTNDECPFCGSKKARKFNWGKAGWKIGGVGIGNLK